VSERQTDNDKPVLVVTDGPLRGQQWVMHGSQLLIGRGSHCDVVIPERRISREHIRLWRQDGSCFIDDLESKNGTHVNGIRLDGTAELHEGDEIQIALSVKLKFVGAEATVPLSLDDVDEPDAGLKLDKRTRQVTVNGTSLDPQLSLYQYRLIELLFDARGGVCTREDVVSAVWPDVIEEGISEQAIDALVRRLRDRLMELSPEHQFIVTVRGHGFRLEQPNVVYDDPQVNGS
jgi:DNA-binding winged helix-turn-helix (wHTH) protein